MSGRRSFLQKMLIALKLTFKSFGEFKIPKLSASLAYYTVFSMGPLLIVIISLCGLLLGKEAAEGSVYNQLVSFVGKDTALQLQQIISNASLAGKSTVAAIIGGVTLLLGATSIFAEVQDSINSIWGLKAKPNKGVMKMIRNRVLSFSVIVSLGFLLLVSLAVSALIDALGNRLKAQFPDVTVVIFYIINLILTFFITMAIFAVIFKVLPDAKNKWKDVWPGAIVTTLLFMLGKFAISFYISRSNVGTTYGAAGSLVILLLWVYYSSIILYFGASFTKKFMIISGSEIQPTDYAVTTQAVPVDGARKRVREEKLGKP